MDAILLGGPEQEKASMMGGAFSRCGGDVSKQGGEGWTQGAADSQRARLPGVGLIEHQGVAGRGGCEAPALFHQQHPCRKVPFVSALQHECPVGQPRRDQGQGIGDRPDRLASHVALESAKPTRPEFPWIDQEQRAIAGIKGSLASGTQPFDVEATTADRREPFAAGGIVDGRQRRRAMFDQRGRNAKLRKASHVSPCAIDGIDDPHPLF